MEAKYLRSLVIATLLVVGLAFSGGGIGGNIKNATNAVKDFLCDQLPLVLFIAIIFAALLYGVAQTLPADQKARVMQFAGAALVAALLGAVIYVIGPTLLQTLTGSSFSC